jgi:bifunctional UDP-N-acetylglucosamine pyrophosphorylase/glucosamine-1-phosphate N-acetyltransferase
MHTIQAIVLAAGKSTRFKTGRSKLLEKICGKPMILYLTDFLDHHAIPTTVVVGYQKEAVMDLIKAKSTTPPHFIMQEEQRGTGHAVQCTRTAWQQENILILNGDVPLITDTLIKELYDTHLQSSAVLSFVTAHYAEPSESYGRIVVNNGIIRIVEAHEFSDDLQEHCYINAGIYLIRKDFLEIYLDRLQANSVKKEFYLTDLVHIASSQHLTVNMVKAPFDCIRGINNFQELWAAEHIKRSDLISYWMYHGVRFNFPQTVHVDHDVQLGAGSEIGAGVQLRHGTIVGTNCSIGDFSIIEHSRLADDVTVYSHTVIQDSTVDSHTQVGPFAHLRNQTHLETHTIIGNFVEIKKSTLDHHTKAKHLAYLGDTHIGAHVNIGAGTITCNHDGTKKHTTIIQDHAYIGSNNTLVAPVTIGARAYTAAGSTITTNVPADSLAIARERQVNKDGYALKLRAQEQEPTNHQEPSKESLGCTAYQPALKTADITQQ